MRTFNIFAVIVLMPAVISACGSGSEEEQQPDARCASPCTADESVLVGGVFCSVDHKAIYRYEMVDCDGQQTCVRELVEQCANRCKDFNSGTGEPYCTESGGNIGDGVFCDYPCEYDPYIQNMGAGLHCWNGDVWKFENRSDGCDYGGYCQYTLMEECSGDCIQAGTSAYCESYMCCDYPCEHYGVSGTYCKDGDIWEARDIREGCDCGSYCEIKVREACTASGMVCTGRPDGYEEPGCVAPDGDGEDAPEIEAGDGVEVTEEYQGTEAPEEPDAETL